MRRGYFIKLIIAVFFLVAISSTDTRAQLVSESDISFDILKWHFHHYPKSETKQWLDSGEDTYTVSFVFESMDVSVVYDSRGKRIEERVDVSNSMPVSLVYHLDDQYEKYKVMRFEKVTKFKQDNSVGYEMKIRSKEKGDEQLYFDQNMVPIDFNLISKAD
ncbi:hypothetical protein [Marinoscillum sp. 108]|uniref:hypothetical protein n=1 Tax=Marinoscillum sp. 108 TaxID=2653151 RepID=UPI0012EFB0B7|nr:hypothetical protein [Marinoscillum sp. 108]VXD19841.1 conserved exported hypothetical protein [Marinoscillum sp. 108]